MNGTAVVILVGWIIGVIALSVVYWWPVVVRFGRRVIRPDKRGG